MYKTIALVITTLMAMAAFGAHAQTVPRDAARVCWTAPTQNTDGSALTDLAGYRIYHGRAAATLDQVAIVSSPPSGCHEIRPLAVGAWFFSMTAVNSAGVESARTPTLTKTIQPPTPGNPTGVTVAFAPGALQAPVYSVTAANSLSSFMGLINLDKPCYGPVLTTYRRQQFREVMRTDPSGAQNWVQWGTTTLRLAAPCQSVT